MIQSVWEEARSGLPTLPCAPRRLAVVECELLHIQVRVALDGGQVCERNRRSSTSHTKAYFTDYPVYLRTEEWHHNKNSQK